MDRTGRILFQNQGDPSVICTLLLLTCVTLLGAEIYPVDITPPDANRNFNKIKILDQKELIIPQISGISFAEASDLAYDKKHKRLYMVGDKGVLYSFRASFSDKIDLLLPLDAHHLTKEKGKRFRKKVDSEGLAFDEKGHLLISFERKPKIGTFDLKGQRLTRHRLPNPLANEKHYRSSNKMLESAAWHPKYGILTASELPLKKHKRREQTLYALSGKQWHFLAEPEKKSAVTAIEVMDDGNILILERAYTRLTEPRTITLKKLYLDQLRHGCCRTEVLAKMPSDTGWKNDNFEGLTRVSPHRYLMVSDDNANFFQRTLLIYFEVIE